MTEPRGRPRRVTSIATRRGDGGETSLLYGGRVAKDDPHAEACGAVDEAVSALGVARAQESDPERAERLLAIQRDLAVQLAFAGVVPHQVNGDGDEPRLEAFIPFERPRRA